MGTLSASKQPINIFKATTELHYKTQRTYLLGVSIFVNMPKLLKDPTLKPEYIAHLSVKSAGRWKSCCLMLDRTLCGL